MKNNIRSRNIKKFNFLAFILLLPVLQVSADQLTAPQVVTGFNSDRGTMGIPRWKGYMDQANPDHLWISFDNTGPRTNICYTTDGGDTWSTDIIQIDINGYNDYHMSLFGRNGELFYTWPNRDGIAFRKFNTPAHSNDDRGPMYLFPGTTALYRSNIMVQGNGRIWVFTRFSTDPAENVRYNYSDNGGVNWTSGVAYAAGTGSLRIGSMPYVNGNPALVVLYLNSTRGCEYYLWNGSSFERKSDASIYPYDIDSDRAFTHNVIAGQYMHLIIGDGNDLYHCWKAYNNGTGTWNRAVIENSPFTVGMDWNPISCVRGNDLYVFYNRWLSSDSMSSMVYYRKWSQTTQTWSNPTLVSVNLTNQKNFQPNSCPQVPESSDYVPVYWQSGPSTNLSIYFAKVLVDGTPVTDTIPPAAIQDLHTE